MDPWGTPARIALHYEVCSFKKTPWNRLERQLSFNLKNLPEIPTEFNL